MSAPIVSTKLVVAATVLNLLGNIILWLAAVAYSISQGDNMRTVNVIAGCQGVGYVLLTINALFFIGMLFRAARLRKWLWLIVSILSLALLAYEALFIWGVYILALMAPVDK
jgi:hypothetical protein